MKTLEEYEEEKRKLRFEHGTGIQCPACGDELVVSNPGMILTTYPPRKAVHCPTCKYHNTITA
jgi:ssDNA-binding Zn-finger/Zn-ribbon topoisomerase 1